MSCSLRPTTLISLTLTQRARVFAKLPHDEERKAVEMTSHSRELRSLKTRTHCTKSFILITKHFLRLISGAFSRDGNVSTARTREQRKQFHKFCISHSAFYDVVGDSRLVSRYARYPGRPKSSSQANISPCARPKDPKRKVK